MITGSTAFIGDFNATLTAINSDGNDSKTFSFNVIKGRRVIDWNQTIAGKSYGDAAFALSATKTGTDISLANFPNTLSGMKLWLDASSLGSAGSTWSDRSSNGNHATKTGSPVVQSNAQNGLAVMKYTGNGQYHDFTNISDVRTVFWVVSQDTSANGSGYRFLLCGSNHSNFHNNNNGKFWGSSAHNNIKSGLTRMNGTVLSGDTNYPNNLSIISLQTIGNVNANRFGQDRGFNGRQWIG